MDLFEDFDIDILKLQNLDSINPFDSSDDGNQGGTGHGGSGLECTTTDIILSLVGLC